jgi:hypothetical protein
MVAPQSDCKVLISILCELDCPRCSWPGCRSGLLPGKMQAAWARQTLASVLTVTVLAALAGAGNFREAGDRATELPEPLLWPGGGCRAAATRGGGLARRPGHRRPSAAEPFAPVDQTVPLSLGDGGVWTTLQDLMRWNDAFLRDELGVVELMVGRGRARWWSSALSSSRLSA